MCQVLYVGTLGQDWNVPPTLSYPRSCRRPRFIGRRVDLTLALATTGCVSGDDEDEI